MYIYSKYVTIAIIIKLQLVHNGISASAKLQ